MDPLTIVLATVALLALVGLAWTGGYELGVSIGTTAERALANRRVNGVLETLNTRRPSKAAKNRRKAARKSLPKGTSGGALW